jgi:hypothetical protein
LITEWLGADATTVLGQPFETLGMLNTQRAEKHATP